MSLKKLEIFGEEGRRGKRVTDSENSRTRGKGTGMDTHQGAHRANLINKMYLCYEAVIGRAETSEMPILRKVMLVAPWNVGQKYQECNMRVLIFHCLSITLLQNAVTKQGSQL